MRLLVDTHAYFWWVKDNVQLSRRALSALADPDADILLSAVVVWELATKSRLGKWPGAESALADIDHAIVAERLSPLPITLDHARRSGLLPSAHKDPFDRLLAAQAAIEGVPIITADPAFRTMGVEIVW